MKKEYMSLYKAIKLAHEGERLYKGMDLKLKQLEDYKKQMDATIKKISKKQTIYMVESCAGNCYLTLYLAWFYSREYPGVFDFTCVERNGRLMEEANDTAKKLGLNNITFISSNVEDVCFENSVHVVYSLHACDLATDYTLALGVKLNARAILSVSCCQHTIHRNMKGHPLTRITQYGVYKEMIASMIGDTLRSELLTYKGYKSDIFAFTGIKNSGRNVMLRGIFTPISECKKQESLSSFNFLSSMFNTKPELCNLIDLKQSEASIVYKDAS